MIVFDLKCLDCASTFEAWFGSSGDFEDQKSRNLLCCPMCNGSDVIKALMSPNVGAKGNVKSEVPMVAAPSIPQLSVEMKTALGKIAALQAEAIKGSTWVGTNFEKQAREMEAGTIKTANIYGKATPEQAQSMVDDGISVMPLLIPVVPPEERN